MISKKPMASKEPTNLKKGKGFHKKIQDEWKVEAEGEVKKEKTITKPSGRKGRIDIHVGTGNDYTAVVEIKNSDWDKMTMHALNRNVRRQIRQVWDYIDSQLEIKINVCPGVIFPHRPKDPKRMNLIETLFEEEGISVVWDDETIHERKLRGNRR